MKVEPQYLNESMLVFYSFFITDLLFLLNSLQKPNIQKFKNTFSTAVKLLITIISGHTYSLGDADQCEEFLSHLKDAIRIYKKVIDGADDVTSLYHR